MFQTKLTKNLTFENARNNRKKGKTLLIGMFFVKIFSNLIERRCSSFVFGQTKKLFLFLLKLLLSL